MEPQRVSLTSLVPDGCNYKDKAFEAFVERFMERYMPGFPLSLLDTGDYERWEIEPENQYEVESESDVDGRHEVIWVTDREGEKHWFAEESDAEQFCEEQTEEDEQSRLAFPWAWNWCHYPADNISDRALKEAGFTVARYTDSDGDQVRVCGIDGAGYSFSGAHYAPLCVLAHMRWSGQIMTDNGLAYATRA